MKKIDFKKELSGLYSPSKDHPTFIDVPEMNYLMVDGSGDPNTSQDYINAVEALYAVSYALKFLSKNDLGKDYVVPPLEGLWWAQDMATFTSARNKDAWSWTMMIMQPSWITPDIAVTAVETAVQKKNLTVVPRFEHWKEGLAAQILHLGSYDLEGPTIERLHTFIRKEGYVRRDKHHEIYLSDPRRTAAEKLKTVLRQPIHPLQ